ncbi:MAG TPA: CBS domain-containing protein [Puia sp.]|nr:CBS domain-containing protein [Puia sp.]
MDLMADFHVMHLPVVEEDKLAGLVSEDGLLNVEDDTTRLSQLQASFLRSAAHADAYFFEAIQMVNESGLTVIPVISGDSEYAGSIIATDLLKQLSKISGVNDTGGVIVLEMEKVSFSFSEISKLVETNDAQITQLNTYTDAHSGSFYITLRINKLEISDIVATFQRYEYQVKYYFGEELYENELRNNYDHLMNYLNI